MTSCEGLPDNPKCRQLLSISYNPSGVTRPQLSEATEAKSDGTATNADLFRLLDPFSLV